jgi:hypothetical protein
MSRRGPDFSDFPLALIFPLSLASFTIILDPGLNHLSYLLIHPGIFDWRLKAQA